MRHLTLILALIFTVFALSGCLVPSSGVGKTSNGFRCFVYNAIGFYPNNLAQENC